MQTRVNGGIRVVSIALAVEIEMDCIVKKHMKKLL